MAQKWYQSRTVQASLVGAVILGSFTLVAALLGRAPSTSPTTVPVSQAPQLHPTRSASEPASPTAPLTADAAGSDPGTATSDAGSPEPSASELSAAAAANYHPITLSEYFQTWYEGGLTDLQRDEFQAGLLDKRIVWEGTVANVAPGRDGRVDMRLAPGDGFRATAYLEFDPEHRSLLLSLRDGQRVRVTCVIKDFIVSPFLEKCSILRILQ